MYDTNMGSRPDYSACTDDELVFALDQLYALECALRRERLAVTGELDARRSWEADGATCMEEWLAARHGVFRSTAREWVRVGRALPELPELGARASDGRVSWDKLKEASKVASPQTDGLWAERAEECSAVGLRRLVRRARQEASCEQEAHGRRFVRMRWDHDRGELRLWGRLPGAEGAVVEQAIRAGAERIPPEPQTEKTEPWRARCADALVELAKGSFAPPASPDRATVVVHVDGEVLEGKGGCAEIASGPLISSGVLERLGCTARWQYVAHDAEGRTLGISRATQAVPPALERELFRLYGFVCAMPGCERRTFLEAHHCVHRSRGGPTVLGNLVPLCWWHHAAVHRRALRVRVGTPGRPRFFRSDGTEILHTPAALDPRLRRRFLGGPDPPAA